ncbi:MAG TPA: hypothetical protein ENH99_00275 [Candidatus Pacearchaeota archaeon]|nr:hypothetical protein [Candidatus Pacearchaeota archaeon]
MENTAELQHRIVSKLEIALRNDAIEAKTQIGLINNAGRSNVQVGLSNKATEINGAQIGLLENDSVKVNGFQIAGVMNDSFEVSGSQIAGFANGAEKIYGFQGALLYNRCGEDSCGVQFGLINHRKGGDWYSRFIPLIAVRTGMKDNHNKN